MASPSLEYLRSPFDNFYQILPQGHDKALKQAFYNTGASLCVVLVCVASVAVYYILEAFLRPLLWAVLCGTFLHPFKNTLTTLVRNWLQSLRNSSTPLLVGTCLIPVNILSELSDLLGRGIAGNLKIIVGAAVGLPATYIFYHFLPLLTFYNAIKAVVCVVYDTMGYFNAIWVWTLVLAYLVLVVFFWTPASSRILGPLSIPVWLALVLHLAAIAGPFRVPLLLAVIVFIIVGLTSEVKEARKRQRAIGNDEAPPPPFWDVWNRIWSSSNRSQVEPPSTDTSVNEQQEMESPAIASQPSETEPEHTQGSVLPTTTTSTVEELPKTSTSGVTPTTTRPKRLTEQRQAVEKMDSTSSDTNSDPTHLESDQAKPKRLSDQCFIFLLWAILVVELWMHFWVVYQLGPILLACLLLKKLGARLGSWKWLQTKASQIGHDISSTVLKDARFDIIAPKPIRGLGKLILRGDKKVVATLEGSMDKAISILIILLLLFGTVFMTFFMAVQVHRESVHLVSVTSNVLNNTLHPELQQWLPDSAEMQQTMDSMVGNAYLYGREWIASKLHQALDGDDASKERVEKQVLDVWDQLYEKWFARVCNIEYYRIHGTCQSTTGTPKSERHLQRQRSIIDLSNVTSVWDLATKAKEINLDIVALVKENIGTFMSVMESVWTVLKGNLSLAFNVLTLTTSMVFGGGTAILNFIISAVIFITTLFYLLASSGTKYKPVEWFSNLSPGQAGGGKLGGAVEEAISSVFLASLKMAAFYGLYTWLTHTVFGIQIVFIPSALAAIFAVVPFLGTYFAAVPAVVELWLVQRQGVLAILLVICHLLPVSVVDTAIYSDIKGGHPYLTGLAIAGGMYWLGLEGAIIGPILLCCLVVAVNVYSTMLKPDGALGSGETSSEDGNIFLAKHQRMSAIGSQRKVTFNLHRGFSSPDAMQ